MKTLSKIVIGTVVLMVGLVVVAGRTLRTPRAMSGPRPRRPFTGRPTACPARFATKNLTTTWPRSRPNWSRPVKLNQSARQIEQLPNELNTQTERAEREWGRRALDPHQPASGFPCGVHESSG